MYRFMSGGMDEYRLHDFNILEIRAYVVAFTPNCSGKIKENLNRDGALLLSPTTVQWCVVVRIEDYGSKQRNAQLRRGSAAARRG